MVIQGTCIHTPTPPSSINPSIFSPLPVPQWHVVTSMPVDSFAKALHLQGDMVRAITLNRHIG